MTRVLVVDDKDENRYYLEALLGGHGYAVDSARHGAEALVLARQDRPSVVISDLLMPVMDGYTLLRQWRADPDLRDVPFIVYTATYTEAEDERLAMDLGADAFILKPAEPEDFLTRLHDVETRISTARPAQGDVADPAAADDPELLRSYSETLIRKLEEKTFQLERTNEILLADIAERERIEAAWRSSEVENRLIIESIPQLVWIAAPDGTNLLFNRQWLHYTGLSLDESISDAWDRSIHPDDRAECARRWDHAVAHGTTFEMEFRLRGADGEYRWMLSRAVPMRDDSGTVVKWFGTCTDIEDLKRMEAQFFRAQRLESIGTLAGGIAHDLNNVLAPIVTGAGLLDGPDVDPETRAIVDTIVTSAQRGTDLVRQVLAYARGVEGDRVVVNVGAAIREVVSMIATTFPAGVELEVQVSDDLWEILGDPTQVQQVVLNLCVNARDAVGPQGRIVVAAENVERVAVRPGGDGRYVAVTVSDDGTGIPPELLDRIFDPFVTTKPVGHGSGLGLATVASIVTGHGGTVDVRSRPGQGSVFEALFPVRRDGSSASGTTSVPTSASTSSNASPLGGGGLVHRDAGELRVLLVDDEPAIVETSRRVLEAAGHSVSVSSDPASVSEDLSRLADAEAAPFDVVISDLVMPDVDGASLLRAIRTRWPSMPVVAMSGVGDPGSALDGVPGPVPGILQKPFTAAELRRAVHVALGDPTDGAG